ncbi:MAG TPA: CHAT domain-containing tetratricopeptide repeat protein, partial [Vicinamibacterales bacterium]|nr:CHAT domain-containing tetratricopeptide repeat protein [Vicinamibacterales bacterium]
DGKPAALGHYRRAIAAYDKAGNRRARASAEFNALRVDERGITPEMWRSLASLLEDAKSLGNRSFEGAVLHLWGDKLFATGDFDGAIDKLNEAIGVLESIPPTDELGTTYTSLGRVFRLHGQNAAAVQYQLKALAIHEKLGPPVSLVQSLNAVAVSYANVPDAKRAKIYYERALALADTVSPDARNLLRANYASFLGFNGEPERGRTLLMDTLATVSPALKTWRYTELALIDRFLRREDEALEAAGQAVGSCATALTRFDCIRARQTRAMVNLDLGNDAAAVADHDAALRELEDLHAHLAADDFLKQGFEDLWAPSYSLAIELHFRRGDVREALETAERARSRALLDLLASRETRASHASPVLTTRGANPASLRSDASVESATMADLAATAAQLHSSLLLYWVADDKIYEWVVSPDGALGSASVAVRRSKLDDLVHATSAFGDDAASRGPTTRTRGEQDVPLVMKPRAVWRDLYDLLILPVAHYLPTSPGARLTIVPHGPLMNVPFAALRDAQGRYLLERYAVHSVTAGAMLEHVHAGTANPRSGSMLLVADPAPTPKIPGDPPLPRLPGADAEVKAIARLLPADRTTVLADTAATEPRVLAATGHQAVVHFATHAIVRDADPLGSFLALGRPADGSASGKLSADKIYKLTLDANLVVLSACRSGEGVATGDGIAALARAFFYAGSSSLIVSLWDIADEPTNRLLPAFYREWLKGADKARALRAAQLQLIADLRAGRVKVSTPLGDVVVPEDPAFWAAFILLGDPN